MSALTSSLPTPVPIFAEGGARYIGHVIRLRDIVSNLRSSMSEIWDALMDLNHHNISLLPDQLTDRYLAQYMGRSRRFVQKGLKGLQDAGLIKRHTKYGRRNIEITGRLAGAKTEDKTQAKPTTRPKTTAKPQPAKTYPEPPPTTPEQLAATAEAIAAVNQAGGTEGDTIRIDELPPEMASFFDPQARARRAKQYAAKERQRHAPGPVGANTDSTDPVALADALAAKFAGIPITPDQPEAKPRE